MTHYADYPPVKRKDFKPRRWYFCRCRPFGQEGWSDWEVCQGDLVTRLENSHYEYRGPIPEPRP